MSTFPENASEDLCKECGAHIGYGDPVFHLGICDACSDSTDQLQEDDQSTDPEEEDLVTSDYCKFYVHGFRHKGPVVECREGERWAHAVEAYMNDDKFWPNVWFIGERGDVNLIDMFDALHSEDDS